MQYQKEHVKEAILISAKEEFMTYGFQKASIRSIAQKANILPSNIYNYFKNKDEILIEILKPITQQIEQAKDYIFKLEFDRHPNDLMNLEEHHNIVVFVSNFVEENRELLKLLLFNSHGSTLEKYAQELVNWYTDTIHNYIVKNYNNLIIDKLIIRNVVSIWYNFLLEVLKEDIKGDKLKTYFIDIMTFIHTGWDKLVESK